MTRQYRYSHLAAVVICAMCHLASGMALGIEYLGNAHSRNGYWRGRPLDDTLAHSFASVEANVFLKAVPRPTAVRGTVPTNLPLVPSRANSGKLGPSPSPRLRFWATLKCEAVWRELRRAGADRIGTDALDRLANVLALADPVVRRVALPERPPIEFKLIARLGPGPNKENSGIVKSRRHADLFWMHNDSGDEPRIYPVNRRGENYPNSRYPDEHGVIIGGAINVDWEDIAVDADGHVIIADVGNNENDRRDLVLYYLDEPTPTAGRTTLRKKVFIRYPDQRDFPPCPDEFNFDCEAVFTVGNTVYLLSKNRGNSLTTLYRLDEDADSQATNVLTRLDTFDVRGQAVGADCTPDGKRLVVLTYNAVWLFERTDLDSSFFSGRVLWAPIPNSDSEAICFAADDTLLVADEALGTLYELRIADLTPVR